jgi:hypothetical protein
MSRRAAAKARPHPGQQNSDVKSNHQSHHTMGVQ